MKCTEALNYIYRKRVICWRVYISHCNMKEPPHLYHIGLVISSVVVMFGQTLSLGLVVLSLALALQESADGPLQSPGPTGPENGGKVGIGNLSDAGNATNSVKCMLRGNPRSTAFKLEGDYLIGGVFSIHNYIKTVNHNYTSLPEPLECTGR